MRVFLSGEGPDDLGDWYREPQYRSDPPAMGVIEALLRKTSTTGFEIVGARIWKQIRKFKAGSHAHAETRNVLGLMLEAEEARCDALVFVRDQDGYEGRGLDVEEGLKRARERGITPALVGGVAVQEIEAWVLALLGERDTERHVDAKSVLGAKHGISTCEQMVARIEGADRDLIPADAKSLLTWMARVDACFVAGS